MKITGFGLGLAEFNTSMGHLAGDVQKAVGIQGLVLKRTMQAAVRFKKCPCTAGC